MDNERHPQGGRNFSGSYTTRRDGGVAYHYDVMWTLAGDAAHWSARIKRDGTNEWKVIDRAIRMAAGTRTEQALRSVVEHAIEHLAPADR